MKVSDVMTRQVELTSPEATIRDAARRMAEIDGGVMPVSENDRLVGMITDRDIAIRAVAQGKGPDAKVREVMTQEVKYCYEDDDVDNVVKNMAEIKVHRLPVMSRDKRLVGIVSFGDVALYGDSGQTDAAAAAVSEPGGPHTQAG
jgi:CBS domain-containing protein